MKIGIISSSNRKHSTTDQVAQWVYQHAQQRKDVNVEYHLVELHDYPLPLFGQSNSEKDSETIQKWKDSFATLDGFVFVSAEYNRSIPGFFKNALDYLMAELHDKPVGYVSFGGLGGLAAIQALRLINAEQGMASVRSMVTFSLNIDFESGVFNPQSYHVLDSDKMLDELIRWTQAFLSIR